MKKIYFLLLVLVTLFVACKKDRDVEFSTFTLEDEVFITSYRSVDLSCKVRCTATINHLYLQYDTVADFSTYQEVELVENKKTDVYSVKIDDLLDNTTYYVRFLAVNSYSSVFSEGISEFKTLQATVPTVEIKEITNVLDTTATIGFVLKFDGGAEISKLGICWSMDSVPTIEDNNLVCDIDVEKGGSNDNSWLLNISGLKSNTIYYVCAYAENKMGIDYSDSKSFITLILPDVKTGEITDIQSISALLNGEALFDGNDSTTIYGFCWGEESMPTIEGNYIQVAKESFSYKLSNLNPGTTYYVRAFAKNKIGVVYGEEISFRTLISDDFYDYVCEGYDYVGYGFSLNSADIKGDTVLLRIDNDSIITLYIEYIPSKVVDTTVIISEGDYYEFGGLTLTSAGKYTERFITSLGCDSIVNLTLKVGYEYVDLGLPSGLKWATCNVGATKPEEYGDYFAWGEVKPKGYYDWATYKHGIDNYNLTKYCNNSNYGKDGFIDYDVILDPEDDAATVNWGKTWRMPTKAEQDELRNNCKWICTIQNGVDGYKVTGPNGNSIFLPSTGYMDEGTLNGAMAAYWSSSIDNDYPNHAWDVIFYTNPILARVDCSSTFRCRGQSIRPVYVELSSQPEIKKYTISVYSQDDSLGTVSEGGMYDEGSLVTINATANIGYKFKKWNDGNTDNPRVITVTENAIYVAYFEDDKNWNAGHEYVDLGLSVKWATCNVGAEKPEDYGDYFAWGEIKSKESYAWGSYKYCYKYSYSHGWWTVTKYCTDEEFGKDGFKDNKTELDPEDDVATVNWGKTWRMPTKAEQDELHYNCVWICMAENGVNGCKVIGPNGNSIFLPAAGYMNDTSLEYVGSDGYYWSSSLTQFPDEAYYVGFGSDGVKSDTDSPRSKGLLIRPVCQ